VTLAFYLDGKLLAEYSGMDIAVLPDNTDNRRGISHPGYTRVLGYRRVGRRDGFEICTQDGRILLFDISNGDLVDESRDYLKLCER